MPHRSSLEVSARIDHWWSIAKDDILADPFGPMAAAGLFQIGLPGADAALDSYRAIAAAEQAIAAKTGLLGLASAFAARQMTARFFIAGFAGADQRADLAAAHRGRRGLHGDLDLRARRRRPSETSADHGGIPTARALSFSGRKAWVTNGPVADLFLVLAVIAVEDGRKRYGLFLVPKDTAGLTTKPMKALDALAPATHCELEFEGCQVPASAQIGEMPDAYPAMALPFRDIEDTVGTANVAGLLSWLLGEGRNPYRAQRRQCLAARPHRGSGVAGAGGEPACGGSARWRGRRCSGAGDRRKVAGARHCRRDP